MSFAEEHLERARQLLKEGEERIAFQEDLIDELERDGHNTATARQILQALEQLQSTAAAYHRVIEATLGSRLPKAPI